MSKIAIVGCDSSGKTVFVSALTDFFKAGQRIGQACALRAADSVTLNYTNQLHHRMRIQGRWPERTADEAEDARRLKWEMVTANGPLTEIEMLDFAGENFRRAFNGQRDNAAYKVAVGQLLDYISQADYVVITVGLRNMIRRLRPELYEGMARSEAEYQRDEEAQWVTTELLKLVANKMRTNPLSVVVALTQADQHRQELEDYGAKGLFAKCWSDIAMSYPNLNVVSVASVDKVTAQGQPAKGYQTHGVLTVMKEFSRFAFGDCDEVTARLDELARRLSNMADVCSASDFSELTHRYETAIDELKAKTVIIQELYKEEVRSREVFLDRCRLFEEVVREVERRPSDIQSNEGFWADQSRVFSDFAGTVRGYTRFYQRKVELERMEAEQRAEKARRDELARQEAVRRAEQARKEAEAKRLADEREQQRMLREKLTNEITEITDDVENLPDSSPSCRADLERDIERIERKITQVRSEYVLPEEIKQNLVALRSCLNGLRGFLVVFDEVEGRIGVRNVDDDDWKNYWASVDLRYPDCKQLGSRLRSRTSAKIDSLRCEIAEEERMRREANERAHQKRVRALVACVALIVLALIGTGTGIWVVKDRQKREWEAYVGETQELFRCVDSLMYSGKLDKARFEIAKLRSRRLESEQRGMLNGLEAKLVAREREVEKQKKKLYDEKTEGLLSDLRVAVSKEEFAEADSVAAELHNRDLDVNQRQQLELLETTIAKRKRELEDAISRKNKEDYDNETDGLLRDLNSSISQRRFDAAYLIVDKLNDRKLNDGQKSRFDGLVVRLEDLKDHSRIEIERLMDELRESASNDDLDLTRSKIAALGRLSLTAYQKSVVKFCNDFCEKLEQAQNGNAESQMWIALQHAEQKTTIKQDRRRAFVWFEKAADLGNVKAMMKLAAWSEQGVGTEKNEAQAVKWYERAAEANCGNAYYWLGVYSAKGEMGVPQSNQTAYQLFLKAKQYGCSYTSATGGVDVWIEATKSE